MNVKSYDSTSISRQDYTDRKCAICGDYEEFRALKCGHCFCIDCLQSLRDLNETPESINCPLDGSVDETEPGRLPRPEEFSGKVHFLQFDEHCGIDFVEIQYLYLIARKRTIYRLRSIAKALHQLEMNSAGKKIAGSVCGTIGSTMVVTGSALSFSVVLAPVGVPLAIAGAVLGAVGGTGTGLIVALEAWKKKNGIDKVNTDLQVDNFRTAQIKVLLDRAAHDIDFATKWNIDHNDAMSFLAFIPRAVKLGLTIAAAGARTTAAAVGAGVARAAANTGIHIAGLIFSAFLIPVDLYQMFKSSIKIHKKKASEILNKMNDTADQLDKHLKFILIEGGYFRRFHCKDENDRIHWIYLIISPSNIYTVPRNHDDDCLFAYEEVLNLGEVVKEGFGANVPDPVKSQMEENWYSVHREWKSGKRGHSNSL